MKENENFPLQKIIENGVLHFILLCFRYNADDIGLLLSGCTHLLCKHGNSIESLTLENGKINEKFALELSTEDESFISPMNYYHWIMIRIT